MNDQFDISKNKKNKEKADNFHGNLIETFFFIFVESNTKNRITRHER